MNADGLLAALAQIGDKPAQVQQMRKVIVALAISGKLTAGDCAINSPHLEHRVRSSTTLLATERPSPRKKLPAAIIQEELPEGFCEPSRFVRLGSVATIEKGRTGIKGVMAGPYSMVVTAAERITSDHYDFDGAAAIVPLVSSTGHGKASLHRLHYQEGRFALGTILAAIFPHDPQQLSARFLYEYLTTFKEDLLVSRMIGTANVSLSVGKIADVPVPLVDASTQQKVDELMALCDQLEAARAQREATRDRLATASLARLNAPDPDTFLADARFALVALPTLTTRPDQIKQLRQTILNLAVRGKLVPQNPNDEPASVLLSSIAAQEMRSTKAGSRKRRELQTIDLDEAPFDLPSGWAWGRFPELGTFGRGKSKHRPRNDARLFDEGSHPLIQTGDVARSNGVIETITNYYNDFGLAQSFKWPKGTLCITIAANIADSGILSFAACFPDSVVGFIPAPAFKTAGYFEYFVRTAKANLLEFAPATAQKNINLEILNSVLIPLPPLAEQERIVAKVDELMALCDQLESSLTTGEATRSRLLDALLHEALTPVAQTSSEHPRAAVSGYVISRLSAKRNFGRTAHMKYLFLAEARLGMKLGGRFMREAAGPLDTGIYELEKQAQAAGWYTHSVETLASGNEKVSYKPGKVLDAIVEEGIAVLGPARAEMDRLIDLMGGLKTEQVEIIATLFAAWNDAVLDGHAPDDDWIIKEVREHWHVRKQRFTPSELTTWLGWMRQNDVIPLGHPPRTMQQTTMEL